jgi:hypothetical protein
MEVFVRGSRSSAQEWARAHSTPLSEIPPLNDNQKAEAQRGNISEEEFARIAYAEHLWQQKILQKILRFGRWLNGKVAERNPGVQIVRVQLDTLSGRIVIALSEGDETFDFEMDEDLVEKFLTTGSSESENSIFRLLDVYVPREQIAKAS